MGHTNCRLDTDPHSDNVFFQAEDGIRDKQPLLLDETDNLHQTFLRLEISHYKGAFASHLLCIHSHHFERSANIGSQVGLIDNEKVGSSDSRPSFSGDFFATVNIDHINREIGELRTEGRREVIAPGFDENNVRVWESLQHPVYCFKVD